MKVPFRAFECPFRAFECPFKAFECAFRAFERRLYCGLTILVDHFKLYLYYELTQLLLIYNSR